MEGVVRQQRTGAALVAAALVLALAAGTAEAFGAQPLGHFAGSSVELRCGNRAASRARPHLRPALRMKEDGDATKVRPIEAPWRATISL